MWLMVLMSRLLRMAMILLLITGDEDDGKRIVFRIVSPSVLVGHGNVTVRAAAVLDVSGLVIESTLHSITVPPHIIYLL